MNLNCRGSGRTFACRPPFKIDLTNFWTGRISKENYRHGNVVRPKRLSILPSYCPYSSCRRNRKTGGLDVDQRLSSQAAARPGPRPGGRLLRILPSAAVVPRGDFSHRSYSPTDGGWYNVPRKPGAGMRGLFASESSPGEGHRFSDQSHRSTLQSTPRRLGRSLSLDDNLGT